jgi:hypothetical protein
MDQLERLIRQWLNLRFGRVIEAVEKIKNLEAAQLPGMHAEPGHAFGDNIYF